MQHQSVVLLTAVALRLLVAPSLTPAFAESDPANPHAKWEKEIQAFQAADQTNPPPAHGIVFVGSSSIRLWKTLTADFAGLPVLNRGFGGSEMADSVYFAERLVLKYRPREVVVYAGDNDLANGKTPEEVIAAFKQFVAKVHAALPDTHIAYISVKPSPSRWNLADKMQATNDGIQAFTQADPRLAFINVFHPMLGPDGRPRPDLFVADNLHMNQTGYELWTRLVKPYLRERP